MNQSGGSLAVAQGQEVREHCHVACCPVSKLVMEQNLWCTSCDEVPVCAHLLSLVSGLCRQQRGVTVALVVNRLQTMLAVNLSHDTSDHVIDFHKILQTDLSYSWCKVSDRAVRLPAHHGPPGDSCCP